MNPVVITSRKAKKDFERIKSRHAEIVQGITDQSLRVQAYNQMKAQEKAQADQIGREQNQLQTEQNNVQTDQNAKVRSDMMAHEKERMLHEVKMKELDIKKEALQTHATS